MSGPVSINYSYSITCNQINYAWLYLAGEHCASHKEPASQREDLIAEGYMILVGIPGYESHETLAVRIKTEPTRYKLRR